MIVCRAKVSAGFTDLRSLAFAAFDFVHCSLSVLQFVFVLDNRPCHGFRRHLDE